MTPDKKQELKESTTQEFTTSTGIKAKAWIDKDGYCIQYKVTSKMPRSYYYSALNDVGEEAEKLFKFKQ